MFTLIIPPFERYDEVAEEFYTMDKPYTLNLEHSLLSISKWESKWHKPFLNNQKTYAEYMDYIKCMTLNKNVPDYVYKGLTNSDVKQLQAYMEDPMSATTISKNGNAPKTYGKKKPDVITSEIIYYWMTQLSIPFEPCEKWHINRLLMLIAVCNEKNSDPNMMSKKDIMKQNNALNAARRAKHHTKG